MANLDDFINQPSQPQDPGNYVPPAQPTLPPQQPDPQAEDNARMRAELEEMRAELVRWRSGQIAPPQQPPEDPWQKHVREALREANIGANEFVESPMETFVKATAASMKKARDLWSADVVALNSSMRLDQKFEERYPDLYESDFKKLAVQSALTELRGDPKFTRLLGATETIPQALDIAATASYKKLGIANPRGGGEPENGNVPPPVPQRKGTYGMPGGSRMTGGGPVKEDTQAGEVGNMIKYLQGGGNAR
jgi:hypothetical protein